MAFFKRKTMAEKIEAELMALRARAEALANRHAAAEAATADAKARLQQYLLEADLEADEKLGGKLEEAVVAAAQKRDALADALSAVRAQVIDLEEKIAAEHASLERAQAAEKLTVEVDAVDRAVGPYLEAAQNLAAALEAIHYHYESTEMARFIRSGAAQVELASTIALQELRGIAGMIGSGAMAIPSPKAEPAPMVERASERPATQTVFMLKSAKFVDHTGRTRHAAQFEDEELPLEAAQRALRYGIASRLDDPRRRELRGAKGGRHVNVGAPDIADLTTEAAARPSHIAPIVSSDPVIAAASFTPIDRGSEFTLKVAK